MTDFASHIHLVLPDATERAACFRAVAAGKQRIVRSFASADDYVDAEAERTPAILLFHWRQPGMVSGAALLDRIAAFPDIVAFVAADRLSIAESRIILRSAACDLLPAPLDPRLVRRSIDMAHGGWQARRQEVARHHDAAARLAALTPRERDILDAVAAGFGNKAIARHLALSPRTVEVHRANIMRRAGAGSVAELLRLRFLSETAQTATRHSLHFGE